MAKNHLAVRAPMVASVGPMLARARTFALSRLAAAAVALSLTGAPGMASLFAPEREHRCACRTSGRVHACACSRCHHPAAAGASRASEGGPPCHRGMSRGPVPETKRDAAADCWTGSCGADDGGRASPLLLEAFTVPEEARLPAPRPAGRVAPRGSGEHELLLAPEAPPPRRV